MTIHNIHLLSLIFLLSACVSTQSGQTSTKFINAPQTITFANQQYQQAHYYSQKNMGKAIAETYEYTVKGESLKDWKTLITLTHASLEASPDAVLNNLGQTLENTVPKPIYEITYIEEPNWGVVRVIYPPSTKYAEYESNNWLLDFNLNCKGHNIFQFSQHYSAEVALEKIIENNKKMAIYLVNNPQHFTCH